MLSLFQRPQQLDGDNVSFGVDEADSHESLCLVGNWADKR